MVAVVADVAVTTIHPDAEGAIAERIQRWTWGVAVRAPRGRRGRKILAFSGPAMIMATFIAWLVLFTVGFALVVWPFLDQAYRAESELGSFGFVQALYYSGVTVTVLGYGDITPVRWPLQMMTVVASASGFALLSGIVTYVNQLTSNINQRIHLALRLDEDTRGSADGVILVIDALEVEGIEGLRSRLKALGDMVGEVHDRLYRLPRVGLFYRSKDPTRDPEPAMKSALEAAIAARLLALDESYFGLRLVAGSLDRSCQRMMHEMGKQYLSDEVQQRLIQDGPDEGGELFVTEVRDRLTRQTGASIPQATDDIILFASRSRLFLDGLDQLTRWRFHGSEEIRR